MNGSGYFGAIFFNEVFLKDLILLSHFTFVAKKLTLGKNERLKSRKAIEQIFSVGKSFVVSPYRLNYVFKKAEGKDENVLLQFGVGVSAKHFKKAVDRNRIKRVTREAYRLQKLSLHKLVKEKNISLHVFFNYTGRELPLFKDVKEKVAVALNKLSKIVNENNPPDS